MINNIVYKILTIPAYLYNILYRNRLRVLAYHDIVDKNTFNNHIEFLKTNYNVIDVGILKAHLFKKEPLPKKPLFISFDDGDYTVFENGLPALKSHKCPACLFIITELINTNKDFWFNTARKIEKENGKNSYEVRAIIQDLKSKTNNERKMKMKDYGDGERKQLSLGDLHTLINNKVFIANHSHTHPIFSRCEKEELNYEFKESKKFFQINGMNGYDVFAYPNGSFDNQSEKALKENNIKLAFLFDHKVCAKNINPLRISRIRTNSDMSLDELKVKVSGLHSALQIIKIF